MQVGLALFRALFPRLTELSHRNHGDLEDKESTITATLFFRKEKEEKLLERGGGE